MRWGTFYGHKKRPGADAHGLQCVLSYLFVAVKQCGIQYIFPRMPHLLLEEGHDLINYPVEGTAGIISRFDEITTLFGMLHERNKVIGFIFIDQYGSVTPPQALAA